MLFDKEVIERKRQEIMKAAEADGCACPVCDRFVKVYRRKIHGNMAAQLIKLYRITKDSDRFVKFTEFASLAAGRDFTIMRYWGLIERSNNDNPAKKNSGYWRVTLRGIQYINCNIKIPEIAYVYDDRVLKFSENLVDIRYALGEKFDYQELMG